MIELTGSSLNLKQMSSILYEGNIVTLSNEALERVRKSREAVERIVQEDGTVYGLTTGFVKFRDVKF